MKSIKLIAMDMDGTLLNEKRVISRGNLQALRDALAQGIGIVIASGRIGMDASYFLSDAGLHQGMIIGLNGACLLEAPHAVPSCVRTMTDASVDETIAVFLKHHITFACFQPSRVLVVRGANDVQELNWGTYIGRDNPDEYAYGLETIARYRAEGICKIVCIDKPTGENIPAIRAELASVADISITSSWGNNLEIMPQGVSKRLALEALAHRMGLSRENVMAIGDFDNDIEMIEYAGCGVAMGNGSDAVKQIADHVTLSNAEDGVAAAIRKYALV